MIALVACTRASFDDINDYDVFVEAGTCPHIRVDSPF